MVLTLVYVSIKNTLYIRKAMLTWNSDRKKKKNQGYNMKNMCQSITQL